MSRRRGWRRPALHFALGGAVLFGLRLETAPPPSLERIDVHAGDVARLSDRFERSSGRAPTPPEMDALIRAHVDEEVLVRAARANGIDRSDAIASARRERNLRFLEPTGLSGRVAGAATHDLVVRRRLVERAREALVAASRDAQPSAVDLARVSREHPERYALAARVRVSQIFLSADRHGDALEQRAVEVREQLRDEALQPSTEVLRSLADPTMLPLELPLLSERRLAAHWGGELAALVMQLEPGAWSGPLPSQYGLHLVWVHERHAAVEAGTAGLRARLADARVARERAALRAGIDRMRRGFDVRIERN